MRKSYKDNENIMYRYFLKNRPYRYTDILQDLVTSYNQRPHRSLGERAPATVDKKNADEIRLIYYLATRKNQKINKRKEEEETDI